jgi:hypothetical protein
MPLTGPVTICGHLGQQLTHRMGTRCVEKRETKVHLAQLRAKAPVDTLSLHEMLSTFKFNASKTGGARTNHCNT